MIRQFRWVLGSVMTLGLAHTAYAAGDTVLRATLDNGLQVVIVPDHLAPVVSMQLNYLAGSAEAPDGFPGTAHALEHMMFRGTQAVSGDALAAIGARVGNDYNAETSNDLTQYHYTAPAQDLGVLLRVEADRMRGLTLSEADWARERGAIEQEVSGDLSTPNERLHEQLSALLYAGTPYAHDALGTRPSFDKTDTALLRRFYDAWYAPNNAILVIAGDVEPQAALAQVRAAFGPIARRVLPPHASIHPEPVVARTIRLDTDEAVGGVRMVWRMPGLRDPDYAAANILSDVLASPRYALHGLVTSGRALGAGFSYGPLAFGGIGGGGVAFPKGADPKPVLDALKAIMADVQAHGVPASLIDAAKRRKIADFSYGGTSITGQADQWSNALARAGKDAPDDILHAYEAVTPAQVNALARRLFTPQSAITAILTPSAHDHPTGAGGFGGAESFAQPVTAGAALPGWASVVLDRVDVPKSPAIPTRYTLANGLTVLVLPEHVSHTILLRGVTRIEPVLEEPAGKEGIADLTAELFEFGSLTRDRVQMATALDDLAVSAHSGPSFSLQSGTAQFDAGLALLADSELHPAFPDQAFRIAQHQAVAVQGGVLQSPDYQAHRRMETVLRPPNDPQLRETTPQTLAAITPDDIRAFYTHAYRPDLTTIVVVGDITPEHARAAIEHAFGVWSQRGPKPQVTLPPVPDSHAARIVMPDPGRSQDEVVLVQTTAMTIYSPDRYALAVGNSILGGGLGSRLVMDLRARHGYVYDVRSIATLRQTRSMFEIDLAADPDKVGAATKLALADLAAMRTKPVAPEELLSAKRSLLRDIPLGQASFGDLASLYLDLATHDQPFDTPARAAAALAHVSASDVQSAFAKTIRPNDFATLVFGPDPAVGNR